MTLSELGGFKASEDILVPVSSDNVTRFPTLFIEIPDEIIHNVENLENESIQENILLAQKDSLMAKYNEDAGRVIFTDTENLYRLYDDSTIEYRYLPTNDIQAGDISIAFNRAISFIERRQLIGNADLILTNIVTDKYLKCILIIKQGNTSLFR